MLWLVQLSTRFRKEVIYMFNFRLLNILTGKSKPTLFDVIYMSNPRHGRYFRRKWHKW